MSLNSGRKIFLTKSETAKKPKFIETFGLCPAPTIASNPVIDPKSWKGQ
jgi:hypothetical protein